MSTGAEPALAVYADGPDGPLPDPATVERALGRPVSVLLGFVVRTPGWVASTTAPLTSIVVGPGLRRSVAEGQVRVVPVRLSAMPGLLADRFRPEVVVVGAVPAGGDGSGWRLVGGPGYALAAVQAATTGVVIERWPDPVSGPGGGRPALGPELPPGRILAVVDRAEPADPLPGSRATPELAAIGRAVADLIPDGATIQWGPGAVGAAAVAAIARPVRVRSGLVTEELVGLHRRGLLEGPAETAYLWGGPDLQEMVGAGLIRFREVGYTHDLTGLSRTERFVAINTGLQVGLDGSVNVERVAGRVVSGPGGHPDFAAGAARSRGGRSIVALPSTSSGRSTIVVRPDVVTTPRSDVDVVVTEHGAADLRGCTDEERAVRLISIAAPEHRSVLETAAGTI
jgi:acyl-CoA hydrolase